MPEMTSTTVNADGAEAGKYLTVSLGGEHYAISTGDIGEPPDSGFRVSAYYLLGMAPIQGVVKAILDIDRIVSAETATCLATSAALASPSS